MIWELDVTRQPVVVVSYLISLDVCLELAFDRTETFHKNCNY